LDQFRFVLTKHLFSPFSFVLVYSLSKDLTPANFYMDQIPNISVLLWFHNQRDEVEPILAALYELEETAFELIIIDDASTDGTVQAIQSLLEYYEHDHTFFFEHEQALGRGNRLNEALQQASSSIIWAPEYITAIDEEALRQAIKKLKSSDASCLVNTTLQAENFANPGEYVQSGKLPGDTQFVWNMERISSTGQFFNPFLNHHHGVEWLLRHGVNALEQEQSFFTAPGSKHAAPSISDRQELILTLLRRPGISSKERQKLTEILHQLPAITQQQSPEERDHDLLEKAVTLKLEGQLSGALECVEEVLQNEPSNPDAKQLKIELLERQRRFVEASELKHELQADTAGVHHEIDAENIITSLIVPTALYGKPALEHCLISMNEYCNPATTELIIIDNASLDDTHDYLEEMHEKNFFNCTVITNKKNNGFAASVNQGLKKAQGRYACVIHNDVEFTSPAVARMEQIMDDHPRYALLGPLADSTLNPDQLSKSMQNHDEVILQTDYLDSFCMMIRTKVNAKMDEELTLAFFDDIDLSFQMRKAGHKVGIAPDVQLNHHYGTTTFALDLDTESDLYWKNIAYFNEKWEVETYSKDELESLSRFDQLLALNELVNPLYPEEVIKQLFNELFTDELKTEIMKAEHDQETLVQLVHLMMVMEKRDIMRELEDRLDEHEIPPGIIYEIVRFYFNRNIYSRCLYYMNLLSSQQESLQSELYRLAILIDEKKMEDAIPKLRALLDEAPSNPYLYKLAGDIYSFSGEEEEAKSFYALAHQINPFEYSENTTEFHLK
jgi:GT2 family glycosyltransferase/Tfp pilus assembly protein PilF